MSEIKALDRLRDSLIGYQAVTGDDMGAFLLHADEIEAEIAERYMRLPVDSNNEPIHVGDKMEYENPNDDDKPFTVLGVNNDGDVFHCLEDKRLVPTCITLANCLHHVKPRTVEDILCELEGLRGNGAMYEDVVTRAAILARELRELLRGDAE